MDIIKELYDMKETVGQKIADANKKLHKAGGAMDMSDIEIVDKLTHAMKSLVTTCAMLEAEDGEHTDITPDPLGIVPAEFEAPAQEGAQLFGQEMFQPLHKADHQLKASDGESVCQPVAVGSLKLGGAGKAEAYDDDRNQVSGDQHQGSKHVGTVARQIRAALCAQPSQYIDGETAACQV